MPVLTVISERKMFLVATTWESEATKLLGTIAWPVAALVPRTDLT
jgi:hypothetical protein